MKESAGIVGTLVNAVDIGLSAFSKGDAYGDGNSQFSPLVEQRLGGCSSGSLRL